MQVGDPIWMFNGNRRVYPKDGGIGRSPIFREHWGGFADAFSECGWGLGYTYLNTHTQIRIDHVHVIAMPYVHLKGRRARSPLDCPHRIVQVQIDSAERKFDVSWTTSPPDATIRSRTRSYVSMSARRKR